MTAAPVPEGGASAVTPGLLPRPVVAAPAPRRKRKSRPRRPGFLFRIHLTLVALGIALLAAIYFGAVLGVLAAIVWLAASGETFASVLPSDIAADGLRWLLIAGTTVGLLLLTKGLWRIERRNELMVPVARKREPDLYALVEYLAESVDAPVPVVVTVDCGPEVEVSYDGPGGFVGGRLKLRLGLAAVAAFSTRELAATVAGGLARFSAGTGARRAYFIAAANRYLSRSTAGDDQVDRWLAAHTAVPLIGSAAKGLLVMSRRARCEGRWLKRQVARVSQGVLNRQLEHARRCAGLAGGEITAERLPVRRSALRSFAVRATAAARQEWLREGRLPESLPGEAARLLRTGAPPAPVDEEALLRCAAPASVLFSDFHRTARQVSLLCYRLQFRLPVTGDRLGHAPLPGAGTRTAVDNFFMGCFVPFIPLGIHAEGPPPEASALRGKRFGEFLQRYRETDRELVTALQVEALMAAGLPVDPQRGFGMEAADRDAVHERCRYLEGRLEWFADRLALFHRATASRLRQAVEREMKTGNPHPEDRRMLEVLIRTDRLLPLLGELRIHLLLLEVLLAERLEQSRPALEDRIRERSDDVLRLLKGLRIALKNTPFPLHRGLRSGLHRHIMRTLPEDYLTDTERLALGQEVVERLLGVRRAALERLCVLATKIERE